MAKHLIPSSKLYNNLNKKFTQLPNSVCCLSTKTTNASTANDDKLRNYKFRSQQLNYLTMAAEASTQFAQHSIPVSSGSSYYLKKSDSSESRERMTQMRYFYADPEIDQACEKPLIRLNPMTMMYMGVSDDNSHIQRSANYLRNELPIRLSHMINEIRHLPFIIACNPSMLDIHERCIKAFRDFDNFDKEIKDLNRVKHFNQLVYNMLEMNKDLLALLCDGFKDTRRYIKNEMFIKTNLNKILTTRLGIRLLCEHHIALNKQSDLLLLNEGSDSYNSNDTRSRSNDCFESTYLPSNLGDNGTSSSVSYNRDDEWVGIIQKKFSPKKLIENSARLVTRLCMDKYGTSPKIKIDGHTNAQFRYMPLPLEYIMPELLKNSFRATCEHHRCSSSLPDVNITIALNEKDFVLRIRDRGGGIPHKLVDRIFDYHFTTADNSEDGNHNQSNEFEFGSTHSNSNSQKGDSFHKYLNNSAIGMICEASATRGLAVMHGYGFGLPTSKAYAEYLGGSLTFQSMQGIGSDFFLRLSLLDIEPEVVRI